MLNKKEFGLRLREVRKQNGEQQKDLADFLQITTPQISDMENGKNTYVSLATLAGAKTLLDEEINASSVILDKIPYDTTLLMAIARFIKERQS